MNDFQLIFHLKSFKCIRFLSELNFQHAVLQGVLNRGAPNIQIFECSIAEVWKTDIQRELLAFGYLVFVQFWHTSMKFWQHLKFSNKNFEFIMGAMRPDNNNDLNPWM